MILRSGIAAVAVLAAALAGLLVPSAPVIAADEPVADAPEVAEVDLGLPEPVGGLRALRLLGHRLPAAAAGNDMTSRELRTLLRNDPTAALATDGSLFFREPVAGAGSAPAASAAAPPAYPLAETFALHSNPGAARTLLLDFDGETVSGTAWNETTGVPSKAYPAWDPAGDGAGFGAGERAMVQEIWARVAEDYAPFDIDVTTEDMGDAVLHRASGSDPTYGQRVLIGANTSALAPVCGGACGGAAWLGTFAEVDPDGYAQIAWIFAGELGNDAKSIAEAASHEAGHTFGLEHDGAGTTEYYAGHDDWAPIMGVGYARHVTQWSRGGYPGATNFQDDVAIIGEPQHAPPRADEAPATNAGAAGIPSGPAYIATRGDVDVYALGSCAGAVTVTAEPAPNGPNLDLGLELHTASAQVVASGAPSSSLAASVTSPVDAGAYYVAVYATGGTGYDDYGSLGAYTVQATGCTPPASTLPTPPTAVVGHGDVGAGTVSVSWNPPSSDGGSVVTGYQTRIDKGSWSPASSATSRDFTQLARGSHLVEVRAVNANGASLPARVQVVLATAPGTVRGLTVTTDYPTRTGLLSWAQPDDGGSPITAYEIWLTNPDRSSFAFLDAFAERTVELVDVEPGVTYHLAVRARNEIGFGPDGFVSFRMAPPAATPRRPGVPRKVAAKPGRKGGKTTIVVRWKRPAVVGAPLVRYEVTLHAVGKGRKRAVRRLVPAGRTRLELKVKRGVRYRATVRAVNVAGAGPSSRVAGKAVRGR